MKSKRLILVAILAFVVGGGITAAVLIGPGTGEGIPGDADVNVYYSSLVGDQPDTPGEDADYIGSLKNNEAPLPPYMVKSLEWMAKAQHKNGGFGAGTHARQDVMDPHGVHTDPATSALVGMAFIRTGNTLKSGPYHKQVQGVHLYLMDFIEGAATKATKEGKENSDFDNEINYGGRGLNMNYDSQTQPQRKLGQNIDATFASQFLTRVLEFIEPGSELETRTKNSIEICIKSIEEKQNENGSMSGGTWAGVLQSSMANVALEQADGRGMSVDKSKLKKARGYQRDNVDIATGGAKGDASAGISLYTYSSTNRSTAANTRNARVAIQKAKDQGLLDEDADISEDNLVKAGVEKEEAKEWNDDFRANEVSAQQLQREDVLSGFGNNGGEEFISYMMTSEGLVISGGEAWDDWNGKMNKRLSKIQNPDGSWSGHHCITSPVFCTAAVIMTLATDRDVEYIATTVK